MANIYIGNTQLGGGGIKPTDNLPTANQENYDKHELYLNDGELKYLDKQFSNTPTIENKNSSLRSTNGTGTGYKNNKIYRIAGNVSSNPTNVISYYDIESNTETTLDITFPVTLYNFGYAQVGDFVYIIGGATTTSGTSATDTIYKINLNTMEIVELNTKNYRATSCKSCAIGKYIYTFGGGYATSGWTYLTTISKFDTETETITTLTTQLPNINYNTCCVALGKIIYLIGGVNDKNIYTFDTETETITKVWDYDSSVGISDFYFYTGFAINTTIYLFGGKSNKRRIFTFDTTNNTLSLYNQSLSNDIGFSPSIANTSDGVFYVVGLTFAYKLVFELTYEYKTLASSDVGGN